MTFKLFKWDPAWFEQADALEHIAPDWETELQKAIVSKPAFVAMTIGCKEDVVLKAPNICGLTQAGKSAVKATYDQRWAIIHNNLPGCPSPDGYGAYSTYYCYLQEATQLAYGLGWKLPRPMMKLISPPIRQEKARTKIYPRSHPGWRKAFEYDSEGLNALYDFIEQNYFDESGAPIYDPQELPSKKTLASPWLKGRTLIEADTIITSGKRVGKITK